MVGRKGIYKLSTSHYIYQHQARHRSDVLEGKRSGSRGISVDFVVRALSKSARFYVIMENIDDMVNF